MLLFSMTECGFTVPIRFDSKSRNRARHKSSVEFDHAQHSSDHRKRLCYGNTPFRDKTGKILLYQRQGFKIRSSNVLCQPEFGSCCSPFWSIFLHLRSRCYSPTTVGGLKRGSTCAGRPKERETVWDTALLHTTGALPPIRRDSWVGFLSNLPSL